MLLAYCKLSTVRYLSLIDRLHVIDCWMCSTKYSAMVVYLSWLRPVYLLQFTTRRHHLRLTSIEPIVMNQFVNGTLCIQRCETYDLAFNSTVISRNSMNDVNINDREHIAVGKAHINGQTYHSNTGVELCAHAHGMILHNFTRTRTIAMFYIWYKIVRTCDFCDRNPLKGFKINSH